MVNANKSRASSQGDKANSLSGPSLNALRQSEEKFRATVEQSPVGFAYLNPEGRFIWVNEAVCKILDCSSDDLIGYDIVALLHIGEGSLVEKDGARLFDLQLDELSESVRYVRKDGLVVWVSVALTFVRGNGGGPSYWVAVIHDISEHRADQEERVKLEENLRQSQKLEAIGALAGGIAHDFNNILYAIGGFIELAQVSEYAPGSDAPRYLEEALKATGRAKQLVSQILAFSRKSEQEKRPVRFDLLVKEMIRLLRATIPSTIRIKSRVEIDEPLVSADPSQLHQIVMNLCTNAAYSMRENGGEMEILLQSAGTRTDPMVRLSVRDTGCGMPKDVESRIFEPFFTTKPSGEGTGMGLSVVVRIVEDLGGTLRVESEPGVGTTFWVDLPLSRDVQAPMATKPPERPTDITPGKRVLVVDDEPYIVEIMEAILKRAGFNTATASDGQEAWQLYSEDSQGFDLIISDQTMPGMTGGELAQKIFGVVPDQPVILCTGYSEKLTEEEATSLGVRQFLLKPVRNKNLLEAVEKALGVTS